MGSRERIGENLLPEVPESFKESDAFAPQGVSKHVDQRFEVDSRIESPGFQLLVDVDEQSGRLFRGSFQVGSHPPIVFKVWNRVQTLNASGRRLSDEQSPYQTRAHRAAKLLRPPRRWTTLRCLRVTSEQGHYEARGLA